MTIIQKSEINSIKGDLFHSWLLRCHFGTICLCPRLKVCEGNLLCILHILLGVSCLQGILWGQYWSCRTDWNKSGGIVWQLPEWLHGMGTQLKVQYHSNPLKELVVTPSPWAKFGMWTIDKDKQLMFKVVVCNPSELSSGLLATQLLGYKIVQHCGNGRGKKKNINKGKAQHFNKQTVNWIIAMKFP